MQKRKLTQEDLDANPELKEQGLNPGDEIEIPDNEENESFNGGGNANDDPADGDTGGSNPPPDKGRG